jgi:hypothetical protein
MWSALKCKDATLRRIRRICAPILPVLTFVDPIAWFPATHYPPPLTTHASNRCDSLLTRPITCHERSEAYSRYGLNCTRLYEANEHITRAVYGNPIAAGA